MIELIFLFPLLYGLIKKMRIWGLLICFTINVLFEHMGYFCKLSFEVYRLLVFRYLFIVCAGIYVYICNNQKILKGEKIFNYILAVISFPLGAFFLANNLYIFYPIATCPIGHSTTALTGLYIVPPMALYIKFVKINSKGFGNTIGKITFNVFLFQMCFYKFGQYTIISSNVGMELAFSFPVCLIGGGIFYILENKLTSFLIKKINSLENKKVKCQ